MMQYALIASLTASMGLGGFAWAQHSRAKALKHENAILSVNIETLETEKDLALIARQVSDARLVAVAAKAKEYDNLREDILRNGEEAVIPEWLLSVLVSLRQNPDSEAD